MKRCTLVIATTVAMPSSYAGVDVPVAIAQTLAAGQARNLLIQLAEADIEAEATAERARLGLAFDGPTITERKASRYAERKRSVLLGLHTSGFEVLRDYSHLPMLLVQIQTLDALEEWSQQEYVTAIFADSMVRAMQAVPWNLDIIDQPETLANGMLGAGTTIAILDTGVDYTLPDFGGCTAPGNPFDCKVVYSHDFCCDDGQLDPHGHGTNVAGIAANVAPESRLAALRVLDANGDGYDSTILAAMNWAISNKSQYNIVAMNLSLGVQGISHPSPCASSYQSPIANARSVGILSAIAAGNDGFTDGISSPACTPGAVSVGATDRFDNVAAFSNSASFLTILAPGVVICAAGSCQSGTSQAAPHVAGATAVLRAAYPAESVTQTIDRMLVYGRPITDVRNNVTKPRLNLLGASWPSPPSAQFAPQIVHAVGDGPYTFTVEDYTSDGVPDFLVANSGANTISVLRGGGGGLLPPVDFPSGGATPFGLASDDFNADGHVDLAVGNYNGDSVSVLLGTGNGSFVTHATMPAGDGPYAVISKDINHDSRPDLLVAAHYSDAVLVFLGNPDGTFQPNDDFGTAVAPYDIASGDFNQDGDIDIAVSTAGGDNVSVLMGNGDGTFQPYVTYPAGTHPYGMVAADMDADGNLDLVVCNLLSSSVSVLSGSENGTFTPMTYGAGAYPNDTSIADFNADGLLDIAVSNSQESRAINILLGNRNGTFQSRQTIPTIHDPFSIVAEDIDQNGSPDIALSNVGEDKITILLNVTPFAGIIFEDGFDH